MSDRTKAWIFTCTFLLAMLALLVFSIVRDTNGMERMGW